MSFNLNKVPVVGKNLARGADKLAGNQAPRRGQAQFQVTDVGRKRLHSMEGLSGPELQVLQVLSMKSFPISGWEIMNALQGQMDQATLKVTLSELQSKHCVQRIDGN